MTIAAVILPAQCLQPSSRLTPEGAPVEKIDNGQWTVDNLIQMANCMANILGAVSGGGSLNAVSTTEMAYFKYPEVAATTSGFH